MGEYGCDYFTVWFISRLSLVVCLFPHSENFFRTLHEFLKRLEQVLKNFMAEK